MKMKQPLLILAALILVFASSANRAALIDVGNGTVYSTEANITLIKDLDLAGPMTWADALDYVDNLVFAGHADWRLPSRGGCANNEWICDGTGEIGSIYYDELGLPFNPGVANDLGAITAFDNLKTGRYWFAEDDTDTPEFQAWYFSMDFGSMDWDGKDELFTVWAVADGDVFGVMEPPVILILLSGLLSVSLMKRRGRTHLMA